MFSDLTKASNLVREEKNNNSNSITSVNDKLEEDKKTLEINDDSLSVKHNSNDTNKNHAYLNISKQRKSKVYSTSPVSGPPRERTVTMRSSALAAGRRLQDWTTILAKR